jgi:anti-sigma B factor antagonist
MLSHFACHTDPLPGSRALISASGELDLQSASRLSQEIAKATRRDPSQLVIDLSRVTFMDSTALRILAAEQQGREGRLHLVVRTPQIRRLMKVTGYLDVLNLYATLEDAIRASGQAAVSALAAANDAA